MNKDNERSPARKAFGDIAPALAQYTNDVLFGDILQRMCIRATAAS